MSVVKQTKPKKKFVFCEECNEIFLTSEGGECPFCGLEEIIFVQDIVRSNKSISSEALNTEFPKYVDTKSFKIGKWVKNHKQIMEKYGFSYTPIQN